MSPSSHEKLRPFTFHGVEVKEPSQGQKEARALCFKCSHRSRKLYINVSTGQYDCKNCGAHGNIPVFLSEIYQEALDATTTADYKSLANSRYGIPWTALRDAGLALDRRASQPRWLLPVRNTKDALVNLRTYSGSRSGGKVSTTAGLPQRLLGLGGTAGFRGAGAVYLVEGDWDRLALIRLLKAAKKKATVLAVPGANVFPDDATDLFAGRDVLLLPQNDNVGLEAFEKIVTRLSGIAKTLSILRWPSETAEGWDIRDYVHEALDKASHPPDRAYRNLRRMLQIPLTFAAEEEIDEVNTTPSLEDLAKDLPRRTAFPAVLKDYRSRYHMEPSMVDALAISFAVTFSIKLPGDPLWLFLVGPPGCGKTMILQSLRLSPFTIFKSSVTPRSLVSGYRTEGGGDPSLIPHLTGKVFVHKDWTETLTMPGGDQEELYGIFRGAFDGHVEKTFGNGLTRRYPDCHFAMLAGVTDVIHGNDRAALGERFLKFQMVEGWHHDPTRNIQAAIDGMAQQVEAESFLQKVAAAFTLRDPDPSDFPQPEPWLKERVSCIAQVCAYLRTSVPRVRDDILYRPVPEVGTRLAKQLVKLGQSLAYVHNKSKIDKACWRLMLRVALDTCKGWNRDIFQALASAKRPLTREEIVVAAGDIPRTTCTRRLDDMRIVGTIQTQQLPSTRPGRPTHGFTLTPHILSLWKKASRK